jgi:hypothetical protein
MKSNDVAHLFCRGHYGGGEASPASPAKGASCPAAELMRRLVHCGCRGLNMYVFSARSRVFSSFRALGLACRLTEPLNQA